MITELVRKGAEVNCFAPNSFKEQVALTGAKHCPSPEVTKKYAGQYLSAEEFLAAIPMVFPGQAKEALDDIMPQLRADPGDFAPAQGFGHQLIIFGQGGQHYVNYFNECAHRWPGQSGFSSDYPEEVASEIFAGAELRHLPGKLN